MSIESATRKMHPQTCNLMSSGGGGFEALTHGDVHALMSACEATPLIWSYFEAKWEYQPVQPFQQKLVFWLYHRLQNNHRTIDLDYVAKRHTDALGAAHDLSGGLASYLARHKVSQDALSPHFKPIRKRTFNRKYRGFILGAVADLEADLGRLEGQILKITKKD